MSFRRLSFLLLLTFSRLACSALATITNASFEFSEPNALFDINVPSSWNVENYAAVTDNLPPQLPSWQISTPLEAIEGDYFLVLSTDNNDVNYAKASQEITIKPVQTISGYYFFGTTDSMDSNDVGFIKLISDSNTLDEIILVKIDVQQVGDYNSLDGWQYFEFNLSDPNRSGTYLLELSVWDVNDVNDSNGTTFLCIDGLEIKPVFTNGDFELFTNEGFPDFNVPLFWDTQEYAFSKHHLIPYIAPEGGSLGNWKIDANSGLFPAQGDYFIELNTGDLIIYYAKASQKIEINDGDRISGYYFFGTTDLMWDPDANKYNDYGKIYLVPDQGPLMNIDLVYIDVNHVGDYSSTAGWKRFDYTFEPNQAGIYELNLLIEDVGDFKWISYFCVDGLAVCNPPSPADFYIDCEVDLTDFALFAHDWLINCSDPNYANNPNFNCYKGTNLANDGIVDINDLALFSEQWLVGCEP